jgi:hypothetical protein
MQRRSFLYRSALVSIGSFLPFWTRAGSTEIPSWESLVDWARWAPSVHNLQAHRLKIVSETEAVLCCDPKFLLPVGDPNSDFNTAVMGVFTESLSIAAAHYGFAVRKTEIIGKLDHTMEDIMPFARIELVPAQRKEPLSRQLLKDRRTSRNNYDGKPLSALTLNACEDIVNAFEGQFFSSEDEDLIDYLIKINQESLFEDLNSQPMREELDGLFRYSKKEAEMHRTGLWTKCMGFPGKLVKSVFRHHNRWVKGARKQMLKQYYRGTFSGTATVGWIQYPWTTNEDKFEFGRMLCRIWLQMANDDAYMHPFGNLITNPSAFEKMNKTLELNKESAAPLAFAFRAGYSKEPPRSFRIPTNKIILS